MVCVTRQDGYTLQETRGKKHTFFCRGQKDCVRYLVCSRTSYTLYGHLVLRLMGSFVLFYASRVVVTIPSVYTYVNQSNTDLSVRLGLARVSASALQCVPCPISSLTTVGPMCSQGDGRLRRQLILNISPSYSTDLDSRSPASPAGDSSQVSSPPCR